MAEQPIEIPIKLGGIQEIKKELRQLKSDIINSTDPKEMEALAERAGELTDRLRDANEQVNIFAGGSGFERLSNNLGDIGGKLASLDFSGASDSARLLVTNVKSLNPKEIGAQIKGLAGVVGGLGKAFFQMGLQILTNPIFLLATIIVAIVGAIGLFLNKLGLIKPIFDAIGKAIGFVIQMFRDLTDWLGITDNAGEDYAKNEIARLEKLREKNKEYSDQKVHGYENEIKILKASGKDTTQVEREKQREILRTSQFQFDRLNEQINNRAILSKMSADELAELRKQYKEAKRTLQDAKVDLKVFELELETERKEKDKKNTEERLKAQKDRGKKLKEQRQKQIAEEIKLEQERLNNLRALENEWLNEVSEIQQENFNKTLSESQLQEQAINDKYFRLQELAKGNAEQEAIIEEARLNALNDLKVQELQKDQEIKDAQNKQDEDLALKKKERDEKERQDALNQIALAKSVRDAKILFAEEVVTGLNALGTIFIKDQKKLERFQKATALFQIGVDTAKAISSLIATSQANPLNAITFGGAGITQYATGIVQILTNVAKAKQLLSNAGSGGGSVSSGASGGGGGATTTQPQSTQSATPQVNLFGQGNQFNTAQNQGNAQGMVVKAVVSETEISAKQGQVSKFEQLSVL
jgi:hypothetical protein